MIAPPWMWLAASLVAAGVAFGAYTQGRSDGKAGCERDWEADKAGRATAIAGEQAKTRAIEAEAARVLTLQGKAHATALSERDAALAGAIGELRSSARLLARKPAADRPAVCVAYDATPADLSVRDKELVIWRADRADRIVVQLDALQQYVTTLRQACGVSEIF